MRRLLLAVVVVVAVAGGAWSTSATARSAGPAASHAQRLSITIRSGDTLVEANFALAVGVPVRIVFHNYTREFHTFSIPELGLSALILPRRANAHAARTTVVTFTPGAVGMFDWHCLVCPSGLHGPSHGMGGKLYVIVPPSVFR